MKGKALDKRELLKNLVWMVVLTASIALYYGWLYGQLLLGSAVFLSGLLFFCIGLWRVVRHLGLFDSTIYGTKRLLGKTKVDFVEYLEQNPYRQSFWEALLLGFLFMAISFCF